MFVSGGWFSHGFQGGMAMTDSGFFRLVGFAVDSVFNAHMASFDPGTVRSLFYQQKDRKKFNITNCYMWHRSRSITKKKHKYNN